MNVLTKAFVVVVTILSVILVTLVIAFAAQVPNYKQKHDDLKLDLTAQIQQSSDAAAKARADMAAKGEDIQKYLEDIRAISEDLETVKSDRTALEAKLAEASNTLARMTAAIEVANRVNENKDAQIAEMTGLINTQIGSIGEQQGQISDLTQTLINFRADNRRLVNNYLRIQEENKALAKRNEEIQASMKVLTEAIAQLGGDPEDILAGKTPTPDPDEIIRGSVVKIEQVKDLTFVQVNVGTRDKVKEGMEFTVSRGDTFIGNIEIASVDIDEAVGRLTLGGDIKEGDAIRAGGR